MRSRRNKNLINIRDYIVPIFIFLFIFILIYFAFSGDDNNGNNNVANISSDIGNENYLSINLGSEKTLAEVIKQNNKKIKIEDGYKFVPGDTIVVKDGDISFSIPEVADLSLDTNGRLKYLKNSKLKLEASSLWLKTKDVFDIEMRYAKVNISPNSVVNLEQTEVSSTIYLLKGKVEVINNGGVSTYLLPGTKIIISNKNASLKDLDINLLKEDFDDYFKISPWFIKNNGSYYLNSKEEVNLKTETGAIKDSGEEKGEKQEISAFSLLKFDNIYDEGTVNSETINVSGKFSDDRIKKIVIDGKNAVINMETKTFNVLGVDTSNKSNDIIIKVFDEDGNVISKMVYTLYYSSGKDAKNINGFAKVNQKPYPVNGEDFIINIPTVKNGETTSDENTFYGIVKNPDVKSVTVNGYKLKTFNGKTFRYHAYKRFGTLGDGVNNYEIKYYDANGKVILKKYITINKLSPKIKKQKKVSDETKIKN